MADTPVLPPTSVSRRPVSDISTDATKVAWAAGFFDGEGNVDITPAGALRLSIGQANQAPLLIMQQLFGGSICTRRTKANRREFFVLTVTTKQAERALSKMFEYLVVKRSAAAIGLSSRSLVGQSGLKVTDMRRAQLASVRRELVAVNASGVTTNVSVGEITPHGTYAHDGRSLNICGWARTIGVTPTTMARRIRRLGWPPAVLLPVDKQRQKAGMKAAEMRELHGV